MTGPGATPTARSWSGRRRVTWQRAYAAALIAVVLLVLDIVFSGGTFSSIQALGITTDALPLALAGIGETLVILTNGIDLSVGGTITVANVTVADLSSMGSARRGSSLHWLSEPWRAW